MARGKGGGKNAAANDDSGFDAGGPDGAARQRREAEKATNGADTSGGDSPGMGHNRVYNGEFIRGAVEQIMAEKAAIKQAMDAARLKCQPQRKKIGALKKSLQESGVGARELVALLKKRKLEQDLEEVTSELDDGQKHEFQQILESLAPFADLALVKAAMTQAEAGAAAAPAEPVH